MKIVTLVSNISFIILDLTVVDKVNLIVLETSVPAILKCGKRRII
jgi:hypothetical protein